MCWDLVYLSYKACQYLSYQAKAKKKKKSKLGKAAIKTWTVGERREKEKEDAISAIINYITYIKKNYIT